MKELEQANLSAIRRLNQRGGRSLNVADLFKAGTLDRKLLGFFTKRIWAGDSLLAAAGPSGTGKTTLLGALLNLIPPGTAIRTAERGSPLPGGRRSDSALYLAHEINDAPYYGYIWGKEARRFLLAASEERIAATLHAESLEGVREKLTGPPVGLGEGEFEELDLIVTMRMERAGRRAIRRVDRVYGYVEGKHVTLYRWDPGEDVYHEVRGETYEKARNQEQKNLDLDGFLDDLVAESPKRMEKVRELLLTHVSKGDGEG